MRGSLPVLVLLGLIAAPPRPASEPPHGTRELYEAWVSFTDKGIASDAARSAALRELERSFEPRALERRRRRRTLPGLLDEADLPLHGAYVDAVRATGARIRVRSRWMNGVTVLGTGAQLEAIERLPFVTAVKDLHPYVPPGARPGVLPDDPDHEAIRPASDGGDHGRAERQIAQLRLDALHRSGFRGAGIRIGVIDTGFLLSHRAFRNPDAPLRVVAQWDFMDGDAVTSPEPGDGPRQHEHGTLVLGILAANLPGVLVGAAPDAEYILAKAEDEATEYLLEERWFVAALEFAEAHGADVISSSVVLYEGYRPEEVDGRTSVMAQGWIRALGNGVIGVQGAGNSGHDRDPTTHHMLPPAGVADLITVGAVDADGNTARFSSDGVAIDGGAKPELMAPGTALWTISPYDTLGVTRSSGTSMATPLLAGGVACVLQARPSSSSARIRTALFEAGDFAGGGVDPLYIRGHGIPDLMRAAGLGGRAPRSPAPGPFEGG